MNHFRLHTKLAHAAWKIAKKTWAKACKQMVVQQAREMQVCIGKKSELLRAAVSISDIDNLRDPFWIFCWCITEGQLHLTNLCGSL